MLCSVGVSAASVVVGLVVTVLAAMGPWSAEVVAVVVGAVVTIAVLSLAIQAVFPTRLA